ncbi:hypothetical protein M1K46_02405 [Fictibacillus sp. WQ 8-8]|uniref:hypothetical protein n=1 Tax=Fictibacillus sp. WQ 8-8 TaxID=2938788 RepID=UPI002108EC76|nr:hypothetical protein [Fictibacillus sp. WQ 8-8]MCQ6264518.1 hypothetical protein [Fictibacillus sp. WQ 8-8]
MFIAYSDASILNKYPFIGLLIKTTEEVHTKRFELSPKYFRHSPSQIEFLSLEYLVKEIIHLKLKNGIVLFDSDFVQRSLSGESEHFKNRARKLNRTLNQLKIKCECIPSKDNPAHFVARGEKRHFEPLSLSISLYNLSHAAFVQYQKETNNKNTSNSIAQRKLTRNILLAIKGDEENGVIKYRYGNLSIYVEDNTIIGVEQGAATSGFRRNKEEYERLNKLLYL